MLNLQSREQRYRDGRLYLGYELSLGLWLTFKGFNPSAMAALASDSSDKNKSAAAAPSPIAVATKAGAA